MEAETIVVPEPQIDSTRYPELGARIRSIVVDTFVLVALMFAAGYLFDSWTEAPENARGWAFAFIWLGYEPLTMTLGSTLGNYLMKIRVRKADGEVKRINILQAYVRYVVKAPLGWLAFVTVGSNPRRRAIHDLAAGTVMVKVNA